ncbi:peptidyl-prolyl cis-trans isomerase [Sphingomonas bacterium]|uniref:peptidylprolyl isomerase n=1 Tax=Sphingomonas bacterium TaxID=1895847 RepID=UPI001574F137|nr:peptidylprolyl isomerase [Sphingomonas bacterium]
MNEPSVIDSRARRFAAPSERRSLILCGVGAVAGLLVAGAGLFTAQGTRIAGVPPEDVAIVNQVPILMSDYTQQLNALYGHGLAQATPAEKRKTLDTMVREELYVQRGIELGLQNDVVEVRTALVGAVEGQQAVDADATQPTEADLHDFYRARAATYADEGVMTVVDYRAPGIDAARAAVAAIRGSRPVGAAVTAYGLKDTGRTSDGEEFYFAARLHLGPRLFAVARGLANGQVSDPVVVPDGVHLLAMTRNVPPILQPYDRVRETVLADYRADKVARIQAGADQFLRKRADIQIAPGFQ